MLLADAPQINTGDTAWMLTSTALVLMMTIPGLALFYGGLVRSKNVLSTLMHSFFCAGLNGVLWQLSMFFIRFASAGWPSTHAYQCAQTGSASHSFACH